MARETNATRTRRAEIARRFAAPTVACIVSQVLFFGLDQKVFIQPELWHLLDFEAMRTDFLDSFALLHSSPPGLSLVFAAALHAQDAFGWPLPSQIAALYVALTCGALFLWHEVALRALGSAIGAGAVLALLVANPSLVVQQAWAFTPPIEMFLCGAFALLASRWHREPTRGRLVAAALVFVSLVYTRSLWHPAVALPIGVGFAVAALRRGSAPRRALLHGAAFVAIVWGTALPWMAKNAFLFGNFGFTSWMSFNMRMGYNGIWHFVETGEFDEADSRAYYDGWLLERLRANRATGLVWKTGHDGRPYPNMNHYSIPPADRIGMGQIRKAIVERPGEYLSRGVVMAQCFDMPAHYSPYTLDWSTGNYEYLRPWRWCRIHDAVFHGSWLRRFVHLSVPRADWRISFSFFVIVAALVAAVVRARRLRDEREFLALLLAGMYVWMMACVILVDGYEGSRMRWHMQPAALVLALGAAAWTGGGLRSLLRANRLLGRRAVHGSRPTTPTNATGLERGHSGTSP